MKRLSLVTTRVLTDEAYEEYKSHAPLPFDWEELEKKGKTQITSEFTGGKVTTVVMLEEVKDDQTREIKEDN